LRLNLPIGHAIPAATIPSTVYVSTGEPNSSNSNQTVIINDTGVADIAIDPDGNTVCAVAYQCRWPLNRPPDAPQAGRL
jgi:hypothetical protein